MGRDSNVAMSLFDVTEPSRALWQGKLRRRRRRLLDARSEERLVMMMEKPFAKAIQDHLDKHQIQTRDPTAWLLIDDHTRQAPVVCLLK